MSHFMPKAGTTVKGFGFSMGGAKSKAKAKPKAKPNAMASLFAEAAEEEDSNHKEIGKIDYFKQRMAEGQKQQKVAEKKRAAVLAEDPNAFTYEPANVVSDGPTMMGAAAEAAEKKKQQEEQKELEKVRAEGGLTVRGDGATQAAPKYMDKLFMHAAHRKMENDIRYQRRAREERAEGDDSEVFVTSAYKKKLEEEKEFERRMAEKEAAEEAARGSKKAGMGFADFHRNLLSKGLASSTNVVTEEEKRKREAGGAEKEIAEAVQATAAAGQRVENEPVLKKEIKIPQPKKSNPNQKNPVVQKSRLT
jgi:hypothetical protein